MQINDCPAQKNDPWMCHFLHYTSVLNRSLNDNISNRLVLSIENKFTPSQPTLLHNLPKQVSEGFGMGQTGVATPVPLNTFQVVRKLAMSSIFCTCLKGYCALKNILSIVFFSKSLISKTQCASQSSKAKASTPNGTCILPTSYTVTGPNLLDTYIKQSNLKKSLVIEIL